MSVGVELLKKFKDEFANFEKERQELANAEKLFGLPITMYPELLDMEKELRGLDQIFTIYEKQKVFVALCLSCHGILFYILNIILDKYKISWNIQRNKRYCTGSFLTCKLAH